MIMAPTYPIDGYDRTGIRRLARLQMIQEGSLQGTANLSGALRAMDEIKLNLVEGTLKDMTLPEVDPELQKKLNQLFPNMHESYSIALLDITPGRPVRFAERQPQRQFQPGSVGKLAIAAGLFCELESIYPESFEDRIRLLKDKKVRAGVWAIPNEHTVPFFDPATKQFFKRVLQEQDVFSLYEWVDHMLSVSSNGAASVLWRELILMRAFGQQYPDLSESQANEYFKNTPKTELSEIAMSIVNDPLRSLGIGEDEWRLGSLFTRGGKSMVPGLGGSTGTPYGMMKFLIAVEQGKLVDPSSSLELKRLMYMTDRRIRYASAKVLSDAAVYFKSGSLYKCQPEEGYECRKYMGNVNNYMNSVAIVEHPDGTKYLVTLMSNVLKKNSSNDHFALATHIDRLIRS